MRNKTHLLMKQVLALLLVFVVLLGTIPGPVSAAEDAITQFNAANFNETAEGVYVVNEKLFKLDIQDNRQSVQVEKGGTVQIAVGTLPATITKGEACGTCNGGMPSPFGNCGDQCPDIWGWCQCGGGSVTLTPKVEVYSPSDSDVATAVLQNGILTITGVNSGVTQISLRGVATYTNNFTPKYNNRYTQVKSINITVGTGFSAPKNLMAKAGNGQVVLNWSPAGGLDRYKIYQSTTSGSYGEPIAEITDGSTSFTATNLNNGTTYYYYVKAVSTGGEEASTPEISAKPVDPPATPIIQASLQGSGTAVINWQPIGNADSYNVYRSTTSNSYSNPLAVITDGSTSYTDSGLAINPTYYYVVEAVNGAGTAKSNESSVKSVLQVTGLQASAGDGSVNLSWSTASGATGYSIYRRTEAESYGLPVATTTNLGYSLTGLENGTKYYFQVAGTNASGYGTSSAEVSVTPLESPNDNWIKYAAEAFAGGDGSAAEPYQISSSEQLAHLAKLVKEGNLQAGLYFIQTADIDLTGKDWTPIGNNAFPFKGNFNGNGKVIRNLSIDAIQSDYLGLFGYTANSVINNVAILDCNIAGHNNIGGLAGYMANATTLSNSLVTGTVAGNNSVGGMIGYTVANKISTSFVSGEVILNGESIDSYGGIFVGWANGTSGQFVNCYATGTVSRPTGNGRQGGFAGFLQSFTLQNIYAAANFNDDATYQTGGIAGGTKSVTGSGIYYQNDIVKQAAPSGNTITATGLPTYNMTRENAVVNMTGLDFTGIWTTLSNNGNYGYYPQLKVFAESDNAHIKAASLASSETFAYYKVNISVPEEETYSSIIWANSQKALDPAIKKAGYGLDLYSDSNFTVPVDLQTARFTDDNTILYGKWTARSSNTDLNSDIFTISNQDKTITIPSYDIDYARFLQGIHSENGATYYLADSSGEPVTALNKIYKLMVVAEDGITKATYSLIYPGINESSIVLTPKNGKIAFSFDAIPGAGYSIKYSYTKPTGGSATGYFYWYGDGDQNNVLTNNDANVSLAIVRDGEKDIVKGELSGLTNGVKYSVQFTPRSKGAGIGTETASLYATPQIAKPQAPANLTAQVNVDKVTLNWDAVDGTVLYKIYQSTQSGVYGASVASTSSTTIEVTGLQTEQTYYFAVAAMSPAGEGEKSAEQTVTLSNLYEVVVEDAEDSLFKTEIVDGVPIMTVKDDAKAGMSYFGVTVTPANGTSGEEMTVVFVHYGSNGAMLELNALKADFSQTGVIQSGFNVKPGEKIKVFVTDELRNGLENPNIKNK